MSSLAAIRKGQVNWSQDFRGKGSSLGNIFGFYKTRHILLSESTNCTVKKEVSEQMNILNMFGKNPIKAADAKSLDNIC